MATQTLNDGGVGDERRQGQNGRTNGNQDDWDVFLDRDNIGTDGDDDGPGDIHANFATPSGPAQVCEGRLRTQFTSSGASSSSSTTKTKEARCRGYPQPCRGSDCPGTPQTTFLELRSQYRDPQAAVSARRSDSEDKSQQLAGNRTAVTGASSSSGVVTDDGRSASTISTASRTSTGGAGDQVDEDSRGRQAAIADESRKLSSKQRSSPQNKDLQAWEEHWLGSGAGVDFWFADDQEDETRAFSSSSALQKGQPSNSEGSRNPRGAFNRIRHRFATTGGSSNGVSANSSDSCGNCLMPPARSATEAIISSVIGSSSAADPSRDGGGSRGPVEPATAIGLTSHARAVGWTFPSVTAFESPLIRDAAAMRIDRLPAGQAGGYGRMGDTLHQYRSSTPTQRDASLEFEWLIRRIAASCPPVAAISKAHRPRFAVRFSVDLQKPPYGGGGDRRTLATASRRRPNSSSEGPRGNGVGMGRPGVASQSNPPDDTNPFQAFHRGGTDNGANGRLHFSATTNATLPTQPPRAPCCLCQWRLVLKFFVSGDSTITEQGMSDVFEFLEFRRTATTESLAVAAQFGGSADEDGKASTGSCSPQRTASPPERTSEPTLSSAARHGGAGSDGVSAKGGTSSSEWYCEAVSDETSEVDKVASRWLAKALGHQWVEREHGKQVGAREAAAAAMRRLLDVYNASSLLEVEDLMLTVRAALLKRVNSYLCTSILTVLPDLLLAAVAYADFPVIQSVYWRLRWVYNFQGSPALLFKEKFDIDTFASVAVEALNNSSRRVNFQLTFSGAVCAEVIAKRLMLDSHPTYKLCKIEKISHEGGAYQIFLLRHEHNDKILLAGIRMGEHADTYFYRYRHFEACGSRMDAEALGGRSGCTSQSSSRRQSRVQRRQVDGSGGGNEEIAEICDRFRRTMLGPLIKLLNCPNDHLRCSADDGAPIAVTEMSPTSGNSLERAQNGKGGEKPVLESSGRLRGMQPYEKLIRCLAWEFGESAPAYVGRLEENFWGTDFTLYGEGSTPEKDSTVVPLRIASTNAACADDESNRNVPSLSEEAEEFAGHTAADPPQKLPTHNADVLMEIKYARNIMGDAPRKMTVSLREAGRVIPSKMVFEALRHVGIEKRPTWRDTSLTGGASFQPKGLIREVAPAVMDQVVKDFSRDLASPESEKPIRAPHTFRNLNPSWDASINSYSLPFYGRATKSSARNFQLVEENDEATIYLMQGKMGKNNFSLDFRSPFTDLQALAVAVAAFAKKRVVS